MRLRFVIALTASLALLTLAACGSSSDDAGAGPWTFTDDRGTKISLDSPPKRLVAQTSMAAALQDLGVTVETTFGPLTLPDGSVDPQASGLDPDKVTDVTGGGEYGTLDLEKLAAQKPDLLITYMVVPPELWYVNPATEKKVDKLTPTLAMDFQGKSLQEAFAAVEKVAKALGADMNADKVAAAKTEFEAASDRLRSIGKQLGDRKILAVSTTTELLYAAAPASFPDLAYYRSLGLPIVDVKASQDSYWKELSWEKSDTYDGDIIMWDQRGGDASLKLLKTDPVFQTVAGAKDGAFVPWNAVSPMSYRAYAAVMNTLADDLEKQL